MPVATPLRTRVRPRPSSTESNQCHTEPEQWPQGRDLYESGRGVGERNEVSCNIIVKCKRVASGNEKSDATLLFLDLGDIHISQQQNRQNLSKPVIAPHKPMGDQRRLSCQSQVHSGAALYGHILHSLPPAPALSSEQSSARTGLGYKDRAQLPFPED